MFFKRKKKKTKIKGENINEIMDLYEFIVDNKTMLTKGLKIEIPVTVMINKDIKKIMYFLKENDIDFNFMLIPLFDIKRGNKNENK